MTRLLTAAAAALTLSCAAAAPALSAVVITGEQQGNDYVFSFSGSLDVSGLMSGSSGDDSFATIRSDYGNFLSFGSGYDEYLPYEDFSAFGTGGVFVGVASGDTIGLAGLLYVSKGYVSGSAMSGSLTFANKTMLDLGLTAGTYVAALTEGGDTVTLNITADVPLPAAAPLMALGLGGLALIGRRRKG